MLFEHTTATTTTATANVHTYTYKCAQKQTCPGHARAYLTFDILRRIMEDYFGYDILYQVHIP